MQIDEAGIAVRQAADVRAGADRQDAIVRHGDRLRDAERRVVREDLAAIQEQFGPKPHDGHSWYNVIIAMRVRAIAWLVGLAVLAATPFRTSLQDAVPCS